MHAIKQAAKIILNDGIISYPTESVFGLGCNPMSEPAVHRILKLKQRPVEKGLIIVAANLQQLKPYIDISTEEETTILNEKKPITWLVKKTTQTPLWVCGSHKKIAVRISQHPPVIQLCNLINQAIISTSANPAGEAPALNSQQSRIYFSEKVDFYLDSDSPISGQPTTIKDIESGQLIR